MRTEAVPEWIMPIFCGRPTGEVDHPAADEGPAIVDAHDHRAAIAEIVDPDTGPEGKAAMGSGERIGIHPFAARRLGAHTVPGRLAALGGRRFIWLKTCHRDKRRDGCPERKNA